MKIHFYRGSRHNFGDELNPWLWPKLFPQGFFDTDDRTLFIGIGTLLNASLPRGKRLIVCGAGAGYGPPPPPELDLDIHCVRGPHTATLLGLDPALAITDPSVMVHRLFPFASVPKTFNHAYMPHFTEELSSGDAWRRACRISGMHYIDPTLPVAEVMRQVAASRVLLTEALHGAIVADAFRVPFIPVSSKADINPFKWRDWGDSMHIPVRLKRLHRKGSLLNCDNPLRASIIIAVAVQLFLLKRRCRPQLSTDQQLKQCCSRLVDIFALVAAAYDNQKSS